MWWCWTHSSPSPIIGIFPPATRPSPLTCTEFGDCKSIKMYKVRIVNLFLGQESLSWRVSPISLYLFAILSIPSAMSLPISIRASVRISMYKSVIHPFLYLYLDVHLCYGTDNQDLSCFARKAHIIIDEIVVARTSLVVEHLFSDLCLHQAFLPLVNSTHPTFSHSYHHILSTRGLLLHSFWQGAASFHLRPAGTALIWDWYEIGSWRFSKTSHQMTMFRATLAFRYQDDMIFIASDSCSYSMLPWPGHSDVSWSAAIPCSEQAAGSTPLLLSANDAPPQRFFRVLAQVAASPCHVLCCYLYSLGILMQISLLHDIWWYLLYIHVIKWHLSDWFQIISGATILCQLSNSGRFCQCGTACLDSWDCSFLWSLLHNTEETCLVASCTSFGGTCNWFAFTDWLYKLICHLNIPHSSNLEAISAGLAWICLNV